MELEVEDDSTLPYSVSSLTLKLKGSQDSSEEQDDSAFKLSRDVTYISSNDTQLLSTLIQTDKPIYKPGETGRCSDFSNRKQGPIRAI